jgi:hypothetical protein
MTARCVISTRQKGLKQEPCRAANTMESPSHARPAPNINLASQLLRCAAPAPARAAPGVQGRPSHNTPGAPPPAAAPQPSGACAPQHPRVQQPPLQRPLLALHGPVPPTEQLCWHLCTAWGVEQRGEEGAARSERSCSAAPHHACMCRHAEQSAWAMERAARRASHLAGSAAVHAAQHAAQVGRVQHGGGTGCWGWQEHRLFGLATRGKLAVRVRRLPCTPAPSGRT